MPGNRKKVHWHEEESPRIDPSVEWRVRRSKCKMLMRHDAMSGCAG